MRILSVRALLILMLALAACRPATTPSVYDAQKALGSYQGTFGKGIVAIALNYINGDIVSGYDIHQGRRRNLNGRVVADGAYLRFELKEPGDNPTDGTFAFAIDTTHLGAEGTWKPLHPDKASEQKLALRFTPIDSVAGNALGDWYLGADSLVAFHLDGYCEYNFYSRAGDSTSQLTTVRGNYVWTGNIVKIDWEKNAFTPARQMKMVICLKPPEEQPGDSVQTMEGNGWVLHEVEGD